MLAVQGYYDGATFHALENVNIQKNQQVIITILDNVIEPPKKITKSVSKKSKRWAARLQTMR